MIDFFARFGQIFEDGCALASGRLSSCASAAMVPTRPSPTFSFDWCTASRLQAFGGEKLEESARPHDIERTDLRHHVGGDMRDDAVELLLRCLRSRHDLAQSLEQDTRAEGRRRHFRPRPSPPRAPVCECSPSSVRAIRS